MPHGEFYLTIAHEELRSVRLGIPNGPQVYVSQLTQSQFVNNSGAAVQVTVRLVDASQRFLWSDNVPMSARPEVTTPVQPQGRVWVPIEWNAGGDTGTPGDPCGLTNTTVGVEFLVGGRRVAWLSIHAKERQPFTCPGALVTWSATSVNSGGPCRAQVGPRLENYASPLSTLVAASPLDSEPGFTGSQGVTCNAASFITDSCGASIPVTGAPVMPFPYNSGPAACDGP